MRVAIPKEIVVNEKRVSVISAMVFKLVKSGREIRVEAGAGAGANFSDQACSGIGEDASGGHGIVICSWVNLNSI